MKRAREDEDDYDDVARRRVRRRRDVDAVHALAAENDHLRAVASRLATALAATQHALGMAHARLAATMQMPPANADATWRTTAVH